MKLRLAKHLKRNTRLFAFVLLAVAGISIDVYGAVPNWKPNQPIELIVGVSAGSSHDKAARVIEGIFRGNQIIEEPIVIVNKPGGGHNIAMAYLAEHVRNPHFLFIDSILLLTKKLEGQSSFTYTDFTPITQLSNEYIAFAVTENSPIQAGKDFVGQLRKDPHALGIAIGGSIGNGPYLALSLAMKAAGVNIRELKAVTFKGGVEATLAVLGGHVDVLATTTGNVATLLRSGKMRVLAVSSPKRLGGVYATFPTWREQGIDAEFSSFVSVVAARGIEPSQVEYWEQAFSRLSKSDQWKQALRENYWEEAPQGHAESERFLKMEQAKLKGILTELGLAKD